MNVRPSNRAFSGFLLAAGVGIAALGLAGCADPNAAGASPGAQTAAAGPGGITPLGANGETDGFDDPLENTNRTIFDFNQAVDRNAILPAARAYRAALPEPVRNSVRDFLLNLNGPIIFANDLLQGQFGLAGNTLGRFALNSTIGLLGFVDVAGRSGIPYHENDFGITLAVWGVPDGPYIVVPVLGPSNPRDIVGSAADGSADPFNIVSSDHGRLWAPILRGTVEGLDERSRNIESLADLEKTSLDFYATIRSLYRQRRAAQIRHEDQNLPNPSPVQGNNAVPGMTPPANTPAMTWLPMDKPVIAQLRPSPEVSTK